jgi:hypothetical protein
MFSEDVYDSRSQDDKTVARFKAFLEHGASSKKKSKGKVDPVL